MRKSIKLRSSVNGFTLVEALVALLVMAFGMLAISGFQITLSRASDLAKQRSEATRLAQEKIEELRAYSQTDSSTATPHIFNYTDDVVSSPTAQLITSSATNTTFSRSWTATANATDTDRRINMIVSWQDRTGATQQVQLLSVISKFDPREIGQFVNPNASVSRVRRPKNRNINIPYPAVTLSGGQQSAFQPPPMTSGFYVFDNDTGNVVQRCASGTPTQGGTITGANNCTTIFGYLLSGYVRFDTTANPSGAEPNLPNSATTPYDTLPLDATSPIDFDFSNQSGSPLVDGCFAQRQRVVATNTNPVAITSIDRNGSGTVTVTANNTFVAGQIIGVSGVTDSTFDGQFVVTAATSTTVTLTEPVAQAATSSSGGSIGLIQQIIIPEGVAPPAGYATTISKFVSYICVMLPLDHDSNAATPQRWWGKVTLRPNAVAANGTVWAIGTTATTYQVCRYSADYNGSGDIANSEHPLWYRGVTSALDSQNYLVIQGNRSCPTDRAANPLGSPPTFADFTTAAHQPTGAFSFQCLNTACSGANKVVREPTTVGTDIPME